VVWAPVEPRPTVDPWRAGFLTIPHLNGYPAVLVQLDVVSDADLREAVVDAGASC
jgi:hypothetical protein